MDSLHNHGSGPQRQFRYLWCLMVGHREAPMDVSWTERHEGSQQWSQVTLHRVLTGCSRCLSVSPFDLPGYFDHVVYIDDVKAVFPSP